MHACVRACVSVCVYVCVDMCVTWIAKAACLSGVYVLASYSHICTNFVIPQARGMFFEIDSITHSRRGIYLFCIYPLILEVNNNEDVLYLEEENIECLLAISY